MAILFWTLIVATVRLPIVATITWTPFPGTVDLTEFPIV